MNIDFSEITFNSAKKVAAKEINCTINDCEFITGSDYKGLWVKAYHEVTGYSNKYYYQH